MTCKYVDDFASGVSGGAASLAAVKSAPGLNEIIKRGHFACAQFRALTAINFFLLGIICSYVASVKQPTVTSPISLFIESLRRQRNLNTSETAGQ